MNKGYEMQKANKRRNKILLLILVQIGISLACNTPDAVEVIVESAVERCLPVTREKYENYAVQLGQTPEIPKHPESAVYEVCFIEQELSSVRMSDGYSTEEDDRKMDQDGDESEVKSNIPAGTYIYEAFVDDEPPPGGDDWEYELESEFTIRVANDGTVTGYKIYKL